MDKTVKFNIKVVSNGKSAFHEIEVSAEDFRNVVKKANDEIKNSAMALDNLAKAGMTFSAAKDAVDAIQSAIGGLANEYNRFDQSMRAVNTMAGLGAEDFDKLQNCKNSAVEGTDKRRFQQPTTTLSIKATPLNSVQNKTVICYLLPYKC